MAAAPARKTNYHALFQRGGDVFGVEIDSVRTVIPAEVLTRVPRAPSTLAGVLNLRGDALPVVMLDSWLGQAPQAYRRDRPILILRSADLLVGLQVDRMMDVLDLAGFDVAPHPETAQRPWYNGRTTLPSGRLATILSGARLLRAISDQVVFAA